MKTYNVQTATEKNEFYNFEEMQEVYDKLNKNIQEQENLRLLNYISDLKKLNETLDDSLHWTRLSSNSNGVNLNYYSK